MQIPLIEPESSWRAPKLNDLPPDWNVVRRIGLDSEICDEDLLELGPGVRRGGYVVGVSFTFEDGPSYYLPVRHAEGYNLDLKDTVDYLKNRLAEYTGEIVGANIAYDIDYLMELGIVFNPNIVFPDVQVAEPLIDEYRFDYRLDALASVYDIPGKDETLLLEAASAYGIKRGDIKGNLWRLPARYVGPYAEQDSKLVLTILRRQERILNQRDLWEVYDLESALTPVLVDMTRRGVRVDVDRLNEVDEWALAQERNSLEVIRSLTKRNLNANEALNNWVVGPLLQEAYGKKVPLTKTGEFKINNDNLKQLNDPLGDALLRARQFSKLRTTFVVSVRDHLTGDRLHPSYHQLRHNRDDVGGGIRGTNTGRISSSDPNIQQQPSRHKEIAPMWRSIYIPEPGEVFRKRDYSQQEPRLMVHYAEKLGLTGAREFGDRYRNDPSTDFHQATSDLSGQPRKEAKEIGLGYSYGMSDATMSERCGCGVEIHTSRDGLRTYRRPDEAGLRIIQAFKSNVPFLDELKEFVEGRVKKHGYLTTLGGRRRTFPIKEDGTVDWLRKALNILIQGGAAYQMKLAMSAAYEAGAPLSIQVHDELSDSVADPEARDIVYEAMMDSVELTVPNRVDIEDGPDWGSVQKREVPGHGC